MKTEKTEDLLGGANIAMAVVGAAGLIAKNIKASLADRLKGVDPDQLMAAAETLDTPVGLVRDLVHVMGRAAQDHLATLADPSKITRSMLDAVRHAVATGDALRPAAWGPGFYLIVSPAAWGWGSPRPSEASRERPELAHRGLEHARLRNPVTRSNADLDLEDMLGPWVTLPIKDAQIEAATRAADGEEVR